MNKLSPYNICTHEYAFEDTRRYSWEDDNYYKLAERRDELQQKLWQAHDLYTLKHDEAVNGGIVPDLEEYEQHYLDAKEELEQFEKEWEDEL